MNICEHANFPGESVAAECRVAAELEEIIVLNPAEIQHMNRRAKPLSGDPTALVMTCHEMVLRCLESCLVTDWRVQRD